MRRLDLSLPDRHREDVEELLGRHDVRDAHRWRADGSDTTLYRLSVANGDVGDLLGDLEGIEDVEVTFAPDSVLTLTPGTGQPPEELVDLEPLSADEVYLAGLQSVGSWAGFLGYAVAAGAVVWIGLFTQSIFLLVAAMLIAPFAGPAMNAAMATATGSGRLLARNLGRYVASLGTTIVVAGALHLALGGGAATNLMADIANVSEVAVLLPLVAGAAGALNLMQAQRSSLVSGAATGILVAAALAPPAGLVGMAAVVGDGSMVRAGAFLLALQLAGLNVGGAIVFRLFGVSPAGARYGRGSAVVGWAALAASVAAVAALLVWQLGDAPSLQRSSVQQRIDSAIPELVEGDRASLVEATTTFTRPDIAGQDTVLATVHVQVDRGDDPTAVEERLEASLSQALSDRFDVTVLVDVTALVEPTG